MKVTDAKGKTIMIARIIDPNNFILWEVYLRDRLNEDNKTLEEAAKMADYHFKNSIDLAITKAELILKLLKD